MDNPKLKLVPSTDEEKVTQSIVDTIIITPELVRSWQLPAAQRPLKVNEKIKALAVELKQNGGVLPGFMTLGRIGGITYLLDGQHRREAFLMSELAEGYTDIRVRRFTDEAEMGREFVLLNSSLVRLTPDDILRGLEASSAPLQRIRKRCVFVGYDHLRRGERSPILSMSATLRCWLGSEPEVPSSGGQSASTIAEHMSIDEADVMSEFLTLCYSAFGRDESYRILWRNLNLTICAWLYRRTVITQYSANTVRLTKELFTKCLMHASATSTYVDWLQGRQLSNRDRSPCYDRLKKVFSERITTETGKKPRLPQPGWASG